MISSLTGGLGNQMFQYAAAKALASRLGAELKLDTSWFAAIDPRDTPRRFELRGFGISDVAATASEISRCKGAGLLARVAKKAIGRDARARYRRLLPGSKEYFDLELLSRLKGIYLAGYWSSESYFRDRSGEIRDTFWVDDPAGLDASRRELLGEIERAEAVAVHVRRGDYISDPRNARFGTCSPGYYSRAIAEIAKRRPRMRCFAFSEDLDWVRDNIALPAGSVLMPPPVGEGDGLSDLLLMSRCRHFVVANSTYSWWAAWLGRSPDKVVVAPRPWFEDPSRDGEEMVPGSWLRVAR